MDVLILLGLLLFVYLVSLINMHAGAKQVIYILVAVVVVLWLLFSVTPPRLRLSEVIQTRSIV